MRLLISGGGTGGHVFPAIAIADAVKSLLPDTEILFVGASDRLEMTEVPKAGYQVIGLDIKGFQRKLSFRNIVVLWKFIKSLWRARTIIQEFQPDVVVGVGGYASGAVMKAAQWKKIPILIQEQNSYPGITNKLMASSASVVCAAFDDAKKYFQQAKFILTGNPVRKQLNQNLQRIEAYHYFGLDPLKKTICVFGGSLGAASLNAAVVHSYNTIMDRNDIQVLWQAGKRYEPELQKLEIASHPRVKMLSFIERMDYAYAVADVAIARAGALTIAELCLTSIPSVLVPSPHVAEDHQTKNAQSLVKHKAAWMVQDHLAQTELWIRVLELLDNEFIRSEMKTHLASLAKPNAAADIASEIIKLSKHS